MKLIFLTLILFNSIELYANEKEFSGFVVKEKATHAIVQGDFTKLDKNELTAYFLSRPRISLTINNVKIDGEDFILSGNVDQEIELQDFIKALHTDQKNKDKFLIKTQKKTFAGQVFFQYQLTGPNQWFRLR